MVLETLEMYALTMHLNCTLHAFLLPNISCPTLLSIGWFKENLPTTTEEETAVEEAGEKPGGEVTAEDMATEEVEESGSE